MPLLTSEGYEKEGRTFYRKRHKIVQVVDVQSSTANKGESGKFTLSLGIYSDSVQRLIGNHRASGYPHPKNCTLQSRIGKLKPGRTDQWWNVPGDASTIAKDVTFHWTKYGQPWMDRFTDETSVLGALFKDRSFFAAAQVSLLRGTPDVSSDRIRTFLVRAAEVDDSFAKRMKFWAIKEQLL